MIPATRCSCAINVLKKQGRRDPEAPCIFLFFHVVSKEAREIASYSPRSRDGSAGGRIHPSAYGNDLNIAFRILYKRLTRSRGLIPLNTYPISGMGLPVAPDHHTRRYHRIHRFSPMAASAMGAPFA
jgi:hypothetical protein